MPYVYLMYLALVSPLSYGDWFSPWLALSLSFVFVLAFSFVFFNYIIHPFLKALSFSLIIYYSSFLLQLSLFSISYFPVFISIYLFLFLFFLFCFSSLSLSFFLSSRIFSMARKHLLSQFL